MVELTAVELAQRLGVSRRHATDLLTRAIIDGRQLPSGAWLADLDSTLAYEAAARRGSGRTINPSSAWGLLWELSGYRASWLHPSTRSRIRSRIRSWSVEEIARAVSGRTRAHRFDAANTFLAQAGLIATGRAVASKLHVGLMDDTREAVGYVRRGTVATYARERFMVASPTGRAVLYDLTLPIPYNGNSMPVAVIAADLAISVNARERSGGLQALSTLREKVQSGG